MRFSDSLWQQINLIYKRIINHPFNIELAQGTLDHERFVFYMEQDAYYLVGFSRALALIAGRSDSSKIIRLFLHFALEALVAERTLHATFLGSIDLIKPSLSCMAYTQYLIATAATASLEESVAAILPCFWIYREVGRSIAVNAKENNPYSLWIKTYSSQEFSESTDQAIALLDEMAGECSADTLVRMENAFEKSALLEWHFWEDAYSKLILK